jgi:hypothetical protein
MTHKKLLENIYFAALHHKNEALFRANDLLRDDLERAKDKGLYDAYSFIVLMVQHSDRVGIADYKKIFKMTEKFPDISYG